MIRKRECERNFRNQIDKTQFMKRAFLSGKFQVQDHVKHISKKKKKRQPIIE